MRAMVTGGRILLGLVGISLALSLVFAQVSCGLERTLLSYAYISERLESIIEPLSDPVVHEDAVRGVLDYLRKLFSLEVPAKLEPYAVRAATAGFDADWFARTGKRMVFNTAAAADDGMVGLSLPIYLYDFKLALLETARSHLGIYHFIEIDREVSGMPSSYDLANLIPPEDLERIGRRIRGVNSVLFILTYIAPVTFFVLCFAFLRIGSGLAAAGGALLGGGLIILAGVGLRGGFIHLAGSIVIRRLPSFLHWIRPGAEELASKIILGLLPAAIAIAGIGAVLGAAGISLILLKNDPQIKVRRSH